MSSLPYILLVEPSIEWRDKIKEFLTARNLEFDVCELGKEAQLKAYKTKYKSIVVSISVKNGNAFELVRYIKVMVPGARIIFTLDHIDQLKELEIDQEQLRDLGVSYVLTKPFTPEQLYAYLGHDVLAQSENIRQETFTETELLASDNEFTQVLASSFVSGSITVFDLYVRLQKNHYIKILRRGDSFDRARIKGYIEKGVTSFYFKTVDRSLYIEHMNKLLAKIGQSPNVAPVLKESIIRDASEKYIEELYVKGLRPEIVDEGKKLCQNVSKILLNESRLHELIKLFNKYSETIYGHSYLVMFYSLIIAKELNWGHVSTIENLGMGAMLHDIGKMKLPRGIGLQLSARLSESDFKEYEKHPQLGAELISSQPGIHGSVVQIISQHHETIDGMGFPHRLTGPRIFPMAKVVGLADRFVNIMVREKSDPVKALQKFLTSGELVIKFDGIILSSLAKAFIEPSKLGDLD